MKYAIYKLSFSAGVHIGDGRLSKSKATFQADVLFSALCQEALKVMGETGLQQLVNYAKSGQLYLSDSMPYINDVLYLPKPMLRIEREDDDSSIKKQVKKLTYISAEHYSEFLKGCLDVEEELFRMEQFGATEVRTRLNSRDDTGPYQVGVFHFGDKKSHNSGLYIIVAYAETEILDFIEELLYHVGYEGIGGKVSSGLGKFEPVYEEVPDNLLQRLVHYEEYPCKITLSVSLPRDEELSKALEGASYGIILRSGFISSSDYAEHFQKKRDLYCLQAGSYIKNVYEGDIYDVSTGGRHAVYRYAKPMFMGVDA